MKEVHWSSKIKILQMPLDGEPQEVFVILNTDPHRVFGRHRGSVFSKKNRRGKWKIAFLQKINFFKVFVPFK